MYSKKFTSRENTPLLFVSPHVSLPQVHWDLLRFSPVRFASPCFLRSTTTCPSVSLRCIHMHLVPFASSLHRRCIAYHRRWKGNASKMQRTVQVKKRIRLEVWWSARDRRRGLDMHRCVAQESRTVPTASLHLWCNIWWCFARKSVGGSILCTLLHQRCMHLIESSLQWSRCTEGFRGAYAGAKGPLQRRFDQMHIVVLCSSCVGETWLCTEGAKVRVQRTVG